MLRSFEIHQPDSVAAAAALRARFGDEAAIYAGGTELLLVMKEGLVHYPHLIDVKPVPGLATLGRDADRRCVTIGATITHRQIERSALVREHLPALAEMAAQVANVRVRNVGTIGGNVCFAEPHADPATLLLAYGAELVLEGGRGVRRLPIDAFTVGPYETALAPDEVLTRIEVPEPPPPTGGAYLKFGLHERPTVSVAVLLSIDHVRPPRPGATEPRPSEIAHPRSDPSTRSVSKQISAARVSVGCVGPTATRLPMIEARVSGVTLGEIGDGRRLARGAGEPIDAVSDLHGSADYKRHLVEVFVARALKTAALRLRNLQPCTSR